MKFIAWVKDSIVVIEGLYIQKTILFMLSSVHIAASHVLLSKLLNSVHITELCMYSKTPQRSLLVLSERMI